MQQLEIPGVGKSFVEPQKVAPTNLETPEEQVEKRTISPRQSL